MRFLRPLACSVPSVALIAVAVTLAALVSACSSPTSTGASGATGSSGQTGTSTGMTGATGSQTSGNSSGTTGATGATTGTGSGTASGVQSGNGNPSGSSGGSGASGVTSGGTGASGAGSGGSGTSGASGTQSGTSAGAAAGATSGVSGSNDAGVPDGGATGGCAGLALCDDFESDTVGSAPSTTLWSSYTGMVSADTITVDGTQHHSGSQSVKVVSSGSDSWGPLFSNTNAFSTLTTAVYGRFWVYLNAALPSTHHAFMTLGLTADEADPTKQMKGVEATCQSPSGAGLLTWNYNDSLLPDVYNFESSTIPAQTWTCFEFHTDAASGDIEVWLNGTRLDTMSLPNDAGAKWTGTAPATPLKVYGMGLGWMAFNGVAMTLWFDDVALSTSRIGCN
jgi:hypothetical protein